MFTTLGIGAIYHWDSNINLTAYWEVVKNEKTAVKFYKSADNANVLTVRIQYAF